MQASVGWSNEVTFDHVDLGLLFATAFAVGIGLWLMFFGAVVYHGWVLSSHPWAVRTRSRLYWHGIRAGMPNAWVVPGAIPMGLGAIAWGTSAWILTADPANGGAILLALVGFPLIFIPIFLSWRRVGWLLAPWHRTEIERAKAGLEPLIPLPTEGPQMTMTRRELLLGLGLASACVVMWWMTEAVAFLLGAFNVLGLMGAMRLIDRRSR